MNNEQKLRAWLAENARGMGFYDLKWEQSIYGAYEMLSREVQELLLFEPEKARVKPVGRIDLIFRHKSTTFCVELKLIDYSTSNFWDSLKILGYTALYNWQHKTNHKPAIVIPRKKVKLEHHIIANKLKFTIFGITKRNEEYIIKIVEADKFKRVGGTTRKKVSERAKTAF